MKILILNKWFVTGGIERVLISYLKIFLKLKYNITLISTYNVSYLESNFHTEVEKLEEINKKFILDKKATELYFKKRENRKDSIIQKISYKLLKTFNELKIKNYLKSQIKENHFDLIIDFNNILNDSITTLKRDTTTPIIKWIHSQIFSPQDKEKYINRKKKKFIKIYNSYDYIISICNEMSINLCNLNIRKDKLLHIYNPIDIHEIIEKSNIPIKERDYFLVVSRLVNGKGILELIDIYSTLKKQGIRNKLLIIGNGELRPSILEKIKINGLHNDCFLLGEMTNPYPYFKNAKLFLFTSESEGLGMVVIESLACSTPVIAMDCPTGPKDILGSNNEFGRLIPMHDKEQFANAVIELLSDKTIYQHYVKQSLKRANDFSSENIAQQIEILFKQITKQ